MTTRSDKRIIVVACVKAYVLDEVEGDLDTLTVNVIQDDFAESISVSPRDFIVFKADGWDVEKILTSEYVSDKYLKTLFTEKQMNICPTCIESQVLVAKHEYRSQQKYDKKVDNNE